MAQERRQLDWRWIWIGAAIVVVLVFFAVRSLTRERLQIRVMQVSRQELVSVLSTNGRVEPEENHEIHAPVTTTVRAVYVRPGDTVEAGKVLAVLDDVDTRARVAAAESGVRSAQVSLEAATHNGTQEQQQASAADIARAKLDRDQTERDLNALLKLQATGAASASEVSGAKQRLASATATLDAAESSSRSRYSPAEVERARAALAEAQANLAAARDTEEKMTVRAPAAGTVYSIDVQPTSFVEAGKLMMQIANQQRMRVRAFFDEPDLGRVAEGQKVVVKWEARLGHTWTGHIERVPSTVISTGSRNVGEVLVALDSSDGELLPDTNVTVTVTTSSQANMLSIPREALREEQEHEFVYRVVNHELKRTPVVTGTITQTLVAVLSGLNAGDTVATGTITGLPLQEGIPIKEVR
ncbi:efflux RND transporter periplasmic adaptor subunit [Terracidiphilus sp.]|jgi:HlyD family secretion protein|uniref:efflux RND transporter periplasmic adaptor subunit n=1 Tax=Terracidiphilus sp. TaxID=1964191 RepID=UPI003C21D416